MAHSFMAKEVENQIIHRSIDTGRPPCQEQNAWPKLELVVATINELETAPEASFCKECFNMNARDKSRRANAIFIYNRQMGLQS